MQSSPGSGANPTQGPSPGQGRMNYRSEGVNEQPHYITEQQPEDQNDRSEGDSMVTNSSRYPEIPWINDEAFSEESLQLDEETQPEQTESSARMKETPVKETSRNIVRSSFGQGPSLNAFGDEKMKDPPGSIASSLHVVCYHCTDFVGYIKPTGSCNDPSHSHNKDYFVDRGVIYPIRKVSSSSNLRVLCWHGFQCQSGWQCKYAHCEEELAYWNDPSVLPPLEVCKSCHWESCNRLLQFQGCRHSGKDKVEIVVYMDQSRKEVVEIRCPLNYLRMQNKNYQCNHTLNECMHIPKHTCHFPHSKVEEDVWNVWKRTASANVRSRTAKQFCKEIKEAYRNLLQKQVAGLPVLASHVQESPFSVRRPAQPSRQTSKNAARPTRPSQPMSGKVNNRELLDATLTAVNYKDKFLLLNELEKQEHEQALERYNDTFTFQEYVYDPHYDKWPHKHKWYGSLEVSQSLGDYVRQAATQVELKKEGGWKLTGDLISTPKFFKEKYTLLVGFNTNEKPREMFQQAARYLRLKVRASFFLKYRYFKNLQSAIENLPNAVISKLVAECLLHERMPLDYLTTFPDGFQLDDEHQGEVCQKLLRASPDLPFLITGPFGAGKTRVIAATVFSILKASPQSHILIATHHQKTADEYVESYFTEDLVKREGLKVVRLVSKDTLRGRITGLIKDPEMVNDNLENFQLIITTFVLSMSLSPRLKEGHFSHIFIDEAAQAREPETIAALRLAGQETKIVIAGDHMQVGPKTSVLGEVPRKKGLSVSLVVRLYNLYRKMRITSHHSKLLINYRSVPSIIRLPNRLFYKCGLQTRAESICLPDWDKVVYFVCSSLDTNELAAGGTWDTEGEFETEAKLVVKVMVQLVEKYIGKQCESKSPNVNPTVMRKVDPSSVCVMFPTRFTENLWRRAVRDSPKLRKITSTVAYDIQGREFEAVFVCTAEPVKQDYSPSDPVKSMCDRYMFNTIITRPKSLIVAIGNPFRLRKVEKKMLDESPACWSEYMYQCWEGDSFLLSTALREDLGACKKQLDKLKELMFQMATSKLHISPQAKEREEGNDEDPILQDYREGHSSGWKLGEVTRVEVEVMDKEESLLCTECKLDGYRAIPKDPHLEPFIIPTVDNRRCAFDGAVVQVKEVGRTEDGRTGKVVNVEEQGAVDPIICTVDPLNSLILVPVGGKNPKLVNQPEGTEAERVIKSTGTEAMVKYYRPECLTHSVDAIPYKAAVDMFFVVQPLEWSVKERYPIGAVVGVLPKRPPLQLAEKILAIQHKLPAPSNWSTTASSSGPPPLPKPHVQFKTAIGIRDLAGRCTCCFSVETEKDHFTVAVHICNISELVSKMEEYKERRFSEWFASHLVLPHNVVQASDFSENHIQKTITAMFKVKGIVPTQKDMLTAQLSITPMSIQETVAQCSTMLSMSDVEDVLLSLQKGHIGDRKLKQRTTVSCIDALAILYGTAKYHHKIRLGHGGCPLLELASYDFPETEKMVNELLTMANSEAAKKIVNTFPDRALLVNQEADHSKEGSSKEIFPSLAVLPAIYLRLNLQGPATPKPAQAWIVCADKMKALVEALKNADFLKVRQLLYFLPCHPWITPLQEASGSVLAPEQFTVGCSQSAGKAPTHCLRRVPYTSFTDPLRCVGDIYVQEQLLAAVRNKKLSMTIKDVHHIAMNCNKARLNAKGYRSSMSKLHWGYFAQSSFICVQSVVKSVERGKLHLCYQYDCQNNVQEKFVAQASMTFHHSTYSAKVTTLSGMCQVGTSFEYQVGSEGRVGQGYATCSMLTAPKTVLVPTETISTVVECIDAFEEEKVARALESLQKLLKQEHPSSTQSGAPAEPKLQDAHFVLLEFPLNLSSYQLVDVWMRVDYSQCIAKPEPVLLDMAHDVRVCLHHMEQPEACFTSGAVMVPHQVHLSVESYVRTWGEVLLAEAACRSVECQQHILINDVLIQFAKFEALDVVGSEEFYRPVGEVTMVLPRAFVEDRQDIFPLEQGDLVCARYEVNLAEEEEEASLELLERHDNSFPPHHKPVGRLVLHMVVERVVLEGTQQEVMLSQEVVQCGLQVYLRVVGEQGTHLSPLMRDLLVANKHTCQVEMVPMEPELRRVYQCLKGMDRLVEPSELGKDIIFGNLGRFTTAEVPDCPSLAEMEKEYPKLTHVWNKLGQESLNDSQRSAFLKAYHGMFHIIQGPPGTGELEVAVHLALAFAQKNRLNEVMMTDKKQPCVLLCAPSDTAVDTALSHLKFAAGSGDKDIRLLRIYSREVERKHCPGPYQDTNVFEETATADYSIPQSEEKFALHHLTSGKLALPAELEEKVQYSNMEVPPPDQRNEYRRLLAEAERQVIQEGKFDIVLCTCSEAGSARFQRHFTPFQCIVCEASLASEPETVAAISQSCHQVVLIGDHSSVCPPVWSKVARLAGLGVSLFERYARQLINEENEYSKQLYSFLDEQSRMVSPLSEFPSQEFYNGQLKTCSKIQPWMSTGLDFLWPTGNRQPIVFCNVNGTEETDQATLKSAEDAIFNETEAAKVVDIVQRIVAVIGEERANTKDLLAVLTTTEAQKSLIQNLLQSSKMDKTLKGDVSSQVTTFSASRGITANLVILSTVRSCPTGALPQDRTALLDRQWREEHLGLLCQPHHTCQALTTGKHGLVIVGDKNLLCHNDIWRHLVENCNEKRCFVDGDAFPPPQSMSPSPMEREPESCFRSDFESHRKLGKGTFGVVYRCQNKVDGKFYAVKCIKLPCKRNAWEKVTREAKALAQLDHPHIVRYHHSWVEKEWEGCLPTDEEDESCSNSSLSATPNPSKPSLNNASPHSTTSHSSSVVTFAFGSRSLAFQGEDTSENKSDAVTENCQDFESSSAPTGEGTTGDGPPPEHLFIQMELCCKDSLQNWLWNNEKNRSRRIVLQYFEQILDAVCYVHQKGMMHRDLKPSNIFFSIDDSDKIKIGDFGLVTGALDSFPSSPSTSSRGSELDTPRSRKGRTHSIGTSLYSSPEQKKGMDYDQKVDVYSLGVIFFEMNHPFTTEMERAKVLEKVHSGIFPDKFKELLPTEVEMVQWMLSPDPTNRPSAEQVASSAILKRIKDGMQGTPDQCLPQL